MCSLFVFANYGLLSYLTDHPSLSLTPLTRLSSTINIDIDIGVVCMLHRPPTTPARLRDHPILHSFRHRPHAVLIPIDPCRAYPRHSTHSPSTIDVDIVHNLHDSLRFTLQRRCVVAGAPTIYGCRPVVAATSYGVVRTRSEEEEERDKLAPLPKRHKTYSTSNHRYQSLVSHWM